MIFGRGLVGKIAPGTKWRHSSRKSSIATVTQVIGARVLYTTSKGDKRETDAYSFVQCYRLVSAT